MKHCARSAIWMAQHIVETCCTARSSTHTAQAYMGDHRSTLRCTTHNTFVRIILPLTSWIR